ncbi:type II secretion system protein D (GspD) [Basfia succiniciproducens]|uniref:Type II secretion system protein D (GspD) n=2 Tax=Basfia succiniciproducens TaxID=653940 RepID=A0A1G5EH49_9PAST|nr:secretin [Basfia succiniciproducens]SCY26286.1 type II secretion system protein D (GspD) [Basfia succiniciproducens]
MPICKQITRKIMTAALTAFMLVCAAPIFAKPMYLEQGKSKYIELDKKIDTIFVSSSEVADYEIVDDYSFMVYGKQEGTTDVTAFDANGNILYTDTLNVNALINNIVDTNKQIKARFPNSNLQVKKLGKAYVIEGKANTQHESEEVNRIVGEAIGVAPKVTETTLKRGNGMSDEKIPFLDKYEYNGVINNTNVDKTKQINVKLTVAEVNKNFSDSLGIKWEHLSGSVLENWTSGANGYSGGFDGTTGSIALINANRLSAFITAVNNANNGKILAEPNISMLSGETADILVGGEVPFAQRDSDGNTSIIYKDFGVKLMVGAKVQKNDQVRIVLAQEVSTLAGNYTYTSVGDIPYFQTRRAKSTFEVGNGESFIIGGLLSSSDLEGVSKVPLFGDIPILGAFFRSVTTSRETKELVVVATVNLVTPNDAEKVIYPSFEQTGTLERFFNLMPFKNVYHKTLTTNFMKNGGFIQ